MEKYQILVLGASNEGKTRLLEIFLEKKILEPLHCDGHLKQNVYVGVGGGKEIDITVCHTKDYKDLSDDDKQVIINDADAFVLVYSKSCENSFCLPKQILEEIKELGKAGAHITLVETKSAKRKRKPTYWMTQISNEVDKIVASWEWPKLSHVITRDGQDEKNIFIKLAEQLSEDEEQRKRQEELRVEVRNEAAQNESMDIKSYEFAVLGDRKVGKTTLIRDFLKTKIDKTRSMNSYVHKVAREGKQAKFSIVHTISYEALPKHDQELAIEHADAYILVYSITSKKSFYVIKKILEDITVINKQETPMVLVGTYISTKNTKVVNKEQVDELVHEWKHRIHLEMKAGHQAIDGELVFGKLAEMLSCFDASPK